MQNIITTKGFDYGFDPSKCVGCEGRCCTGESGYIWLNPKETEKIASFLNIDINDFKKRYLRKIGYRYSLKEKVAGSEFECIFFNNKAGNCSIYEHRPLQCKTFPFWDYFKEHKDEVVKECPGIVL